MIAIIDYGVGNLFSLESSFAKIGAEVEVTCDEKVIGSAEKIVLPGVGAFEDAARKLRESGMWDAVIREAKSGKQMLGICLGMQLLFDRSFEYGEHKGLGLIPGDVVPMKNRISEELKIPHIGWNSLLFTGKKSQLFRYIKDGDYVYFVHSYFADRCDESIIAKTEYGENLCAAVQRDNIYGCQFHPEKSGDVGLSILRAFCEP